MPTLQASEVKYTFKLEEIQQLIAKDLNVDPNKIKVRYVIEEVGGDPMDRYRGTDTVTRIEVTVDTK